MYQSLPSLVATYRILAASSTKRTRGCHLLSSKSARYAGTTEQRSISWDITTAEFCGNAAKMHEAMLTAYGESRGQFVALLDRNGAQTHENNNTSNE